MPEQILVEQTLDQANQFGVNCVAVNNDLPVEFTNGQAILVTHIQKLFNGKTKFRLGTQSQKVSAVVLDDAHSCIDAIKDAFTINLAGTHPAYQRILALFDGELSEQGPGTHEDIKRHKNDSLLAIPYWSWSEKKAGVAAIFSDYAADDSIKFAWPLLKDSLDKCLCIVTGTELEVFPYHPPLRLFGSYAQASHRIFMSATVANDAFLIKGLGISEEVINSPLVDRNEKWSGEKMILIPSLMSASLSDSAIIRRWGKSNPKRGFGVVALTPSFRDCDRWVEAGAEKVDSGSIQSVIEQLKKGNWETTVVIANRYDGIDLPDRACRILILDSAPLAQRLGDRYVESRREGSDIAESNAARAIEQGLGRAVRGDKDFCVVIIIGPTLIKRVKSKDSQRFLSPQTRKQIEIGLEVTKMVRDEPDSATPMAALISVMNQCLRRDSGWKEYYEQEMSNLPSANDNSSVLRIFSAEGLAERRFAESQYDEAVDAMQLLIDEWIDSEYEKGWYLQEMARYVHPKSQTESNRLQVAAHKKNPLLFRPREGMAFSKLSNIGQKRAEKIISWVKTFETFDELSIAIDELLNRLTFGIDSGIFERAVNDLAKALGFEGQRPDKEMKAGPDNLWALKENQYLLFECKNEVLSSRSSIHKAETGQTNNAIAWFKDNYGDATIKIIMIHPTNVLGPGAGFNGPAEVMRYKELTKLKQNTRSFFNEFKSLDLRDLSEGKVQTFLQTYKLTVENIVKDYSVTPQS